MTSVAVIGLGYVGLPVALLCKKKGYTVIGIDVNKDLVDGINKGYPQIKDEGILSDLKSFPIDATIHFSDLADSDIIMICVPTPITQHHKPDLSYLESACKSIAAYVKKGALVVIESTIHPGTSEEIVMPIFLEQGKKDGSDIYLAHCPERIDPGNKSWSVDKIPRVIGATSSKALDLATRFYNSIIDADVMPMNSVKAAEATKIMENAFRDINIAFVNEMAMSFAKAGIDVTEVIKGASTKPFGFMPHHPGCGVGGHCIPVDPYYLIESARKKGFDHEFLKLARRINTEMPSYCITLLEQALAEKGLSLDAINVGVLGLAYKPDVDDIRESPALAVIDKLKEKGCSVKVFDPFVKSVSDCTSLNELLEFAECIILATAHSEFKLVTAEVLEKNSVKVIIDGRNFLEPDIFLKSGIIYRGIGR